MRACTRALLAVTLGALLPLAGSGQTVRGVVRTGTDHTPSAETSVVLVNSAGEVVSSSLTSPDGTYELLAPHNGSYHVRARRPGFLPDSSPVLEIGATSEITFNPVLREFPVEIERLSVIEPRRCVLARDAGATAFRLWQEVQNALSATLAATEAGKVGFSLQRFTREIDIATGRVVAGRSWQTRSAAPESFVSVAPESLAARSYRRIEKDSALYLAPDARTLISEAFASGHCLKPVEDVSRPGMIGLGFEPSHARDGDVRGVLWLDRASLALRSLSYMYIDSHNTDTARVATGQIHYNRLPGGGWFISSWLIRVPITTTVLKTAPEFAGYNRLGSASRHTSADLVVHMWEIGGNVSGLFDTSKDTESRLGRVQGTIAMEGASTGLTGIDLTLERATDSSVVTHTRTGANGAFTFDSVMAGAYVIRAKAPHLDTLNTPVTPIAVTAWAGAATTIAITVPAPETGIRALCPAGFPAGRAGLHGLVTDSANGHPIKGARVHLSWPMAAEHLSKKISSQRDRATYTDANGRYAFCDVEPTSHLTVDASLGKDHTPLFPSVTLNANELKMYDLLLSHH